MNENYETNQQIPDSDFKTVNQPLSHVGGLAFSSAAVLMMAFGFVISIIEKNEENVKEEYQLCGLYEKYLKRPLDFALALLALIFLFPLP